MTASRSDALLKTFHDLFGGSLSLSKARDAVLADRFFSTAIDDLDVPARSIVWKLFLLPSEPLKTPVEVDAQMLCKTLKISRKQYTDLLLEKMRAPDGGYEEGFSLPASIESPPKIVKADSNLQRNNPLSLDTENPWKQWFTAVELRRTISQDVERTFPEVEFFRLAEVQAQLTSILFIYSVTHPAIGYRQGMHELLAPVYYAVYNDGVSPKQVQDSKLVDLCHEDWVAADSWALFDTIMRGVGRWYEWQEPAAPPKDMSPLSHHVNLTAEGRVELKAYVTPIVQTCNHIQESMLRTTDPHLWQRLQSTGIEPQIYGIRWLRLLFTREHSLPDSMRLWDALFACDISFDLAPWIVVAMLIRIRNELIPADYTGQLTVLLRYPAPPHNQLAPARVHHGSLLVRQALALQLSPTPATGVSLVNENWNLLNIPMEPPEPAPPPRRRPAPLGQRNQAVDAGAGPSSPSRPVHNRLNSSQQIGFTEVLGGILERGESLGINKSLMSAVNELKRNMPDISSALGPRSPNTTSFALSEGERALWESRARTDSEMERELAEYRALNKRLGESLTWIVDTLLQDEEEVPDPALLKKKRREAVESLAYARDVLVSETRELEDERLFGEEELRERARRARVRRPEVHSPAIPTPVSTVDSRQRWGAATIGHSQRKSFGGLGTQMNTRPPAPWKTSFEKPAISPGAMPRPPPPSSSVRSLSTGSRERERAQPAMQDPLGALR
ncbi:RabGAP/TBC [Cylindrobasidium torrendii FP15055 ss-10]|uniref:RabGAP/TBC n=1 Tax=Cylindrobasidium torrendii FP15055 ss-10 TaxID=1314674 RepID=A0A0D7BHE1_9AGAR|nr:RabGAP/TBC [Cylindrobasidium torrendii FP15055 ss-10]